VLSAIISDSPGKDLHPDNSLLFAIIRKGISLQLRCLLIDLQEDLAKSSLITTKTMSSWINVRTNLIEISKVVTNPVIESFFMQFSQRFAKRIEEDSDHLQRGNYTLFVFFTSLMLFIIHRYGGDINFCNSLEFTSLRDSEFNSIYPSSSKQSICFLLEIIF
jgi:hypothetical protein